MAPREKESAAGRELRRAGGGRPLHPNPDQVIIAQAKTCPHCEGPVQAHEQHLHAVYDKIELPPIRPIVARVEQHAGQCPHRGQSSVAPVPVGLEPGTPFGASIEGLATYLAMSVRRFKFAAQRMSQNPRNRHFGPALKSPGGDFAGDFPGNCQGNTFTDPTIEI